ncbi:MAG: hypothetical protein AAFZ49_00480 [Cyanobacteria bacterium J06659_2]
MSTPENLWDEQEMAELVGLQLQEPSSNPDEEPVPSPAPNSDESKSEPLLDPEDLAEPAAVGTQKKKGLPLAANPFTKLGVVAAGTGLVIGVLAVFTHGVMNGGDSQTAEEAQTDFSEPMVEEGQPVAMDDRGQLLTDLAMGRQLDELEALAEEEPTAQPEPSPDQEAPAFSPTTQRAAQPAPPVVQRPTPAPPPRPVPVPSITPTAQPQPTVSEPEVVDPMAQWMALSHVGSYGRGISAQAPEESVPPKSEEPAASLNSVQPVQINASSPAPDINHAEEAAILQGQSVQSSVLVTGTEAAAVLATPLIWANGIEAESPQFVVQLTEPLLAPDEVVGLSAEIQLVVQVQAVDDSGMAQLAVVSFIQNGQEYALPEGAIQLRGPDGTPLIAQKYGDPGRDIASMDFNIALASGLSRVAELINRPRSSSVVTNAGGSTITQDTGDPNILAGVLEGAFGELTEQMAQRNQAALEAILSRPTIWYLEPGTEVEVYINLTVAL